MERVQSIAALLLAVLLISCNKEHPDPSKESEPTADFDYHVNDDCSTPVVEVTLENKTVNADSYSWNFGDGTSSSEVNPKKVYTKAGTYIVKLTAYFSRRAVQAEKSVGIGRNSDGTGAKAHLSVTRDSPTSLTFTFEIITDEPSYLLDFGDGTKPVSVTGKITNPTYTRHTYAGPGRYLVSVMVRNSDGPGCAIVSVDINPHG